MFMAMHMLHGAVTLYILYICRAHLVSDATSAEATTPIKINQDANIFVAEVSPGHSVAYSLKSGRQAYLLCMEGDAVITGDHGVEETLARHDAAEIFGKNDFSIRPGGLQSEASVASSPLHVLLVEMAFSGIGRSDL